MAKQNLQSETRIVDSQHSLKFSSNRVAVVRYHKALSLAVSAILVCSIGLYSVPMFPDSAEAGNIKGKVHIISGVDNANAVIYLEKVNGIFPPPDTPAVMDQKNLMFTPEVLPVLAGTTVKFLNSDEVLHNVFTPSPCAGGFNLGAFPSGESKSHVFKSAGCAAVILCDIHPDMQA